MLWLLWQNAITWGLKQQKLLSHCAEGWISKIRCWQEEFVPRDRHTEKKTCEDEGRDPGDASTSREKLNIASKLLEVGGEMWNRASLATLRGTSHANGITSDF